MIGITIVVGVGQTSAEERQSRAAVERRLFVCVGPVLGLALVEVAIAPQPPERAVVDATSHPLDGRLGWGRCFAERCAARRSLERAVEHDDVEVHIEVGPPRIVERR